MNIAEFKKMSTSERLQAMEALWDSLVEDDAVESPAWHDDILRERKRKMTSREAVFISLADLKNSRRQ